MTFLASDRLEAFAAVATEGSFTRGAKRVGVTQSAISQRVRKLEEDLSVTLFVRRRDNACLTSEGEALLRYVRAREGLEAEMLAGLHPAHSGQAGQHVGVLRVAGFSSITRSIVMPALSALVHENEGVVVHVFARELRELPGVLRSGESDLILTDRRIDEAGVESLHVGDEANVLVEPRKGRTDRFLDHDPDDTITDRFARLNGLELGASRRVYLDDIYGILEGVSSGWGRAVVSLHLVSEFPKLRVIPGHEPLLTPVYLHGRASRHRTSLERAAIAAIAAACARVLETTKTKPRGLESVQKRAGTRHSKR
jgi:DNA-binding transcriptional LysR family regulator